jgi:hypothetical protein
MLALADQAFAQTFALLVTFLGIGVIVNVLIVYVVAQVWGEHQRNQQRRSGRATYDGE